MPRGIYKRTQYHRDIIIKRNKSAENIAKVKKSLIGHGFTEATLKKMRDNHADVKGENNPNWRGEAVGTIGIHIWLRRNFYKKNKCEFCNNTSRTDWALIKDKEYERKRENFIELCRKCHAKYDRTKEICKNGHKMIPENLYNTKSGKRMCRLCNKIYKNNK